MYGEDGSFITAGGYKALPPIPAVQDVANELGPGYGGWVATGEGQFRLTFYSVMWKAGLVNGYQRVQDTLDLSESGDEYTRTRPGRLSGCKLEGRVQYHTVTLKHKTRNTYSRYGSWDGG